MPFDPTRKPTRAKIITAFNRFEEAYVIAEAYEANRDAGEPELYNLIELGAAHKQFREAAVKMSAPAK